MSSWKSGKFSRAWRAIYTILSTELIHSSSPLKSHRPARSNGRIYHIKSLVCYVKGLPCLVLIYLEKKMQQTLDIKTSVMSYINSYTCSVEVLPCLVFVCRWFVSFSVCQGSVLSSVCLSKDYDSTPKTHIRYSFLYIYVTWSKNMPQIPFTYTRGRLGARAARGHPFLVGAGA